MSDRAAGIGTALFTFFQENPNKAVTIDQLMKQFKYTRTQISGNVYNLRKNTPHGKDIELLSAGVWRYVPEQSSKKVSTREVLELEIVKETREVTIAVDSDGNVYKLTLLG